MNQNRAWPGVPNMYMTSSSSIVMRPKSIATVVVVLSGVTEVSSCGTLASVMIASVVTGGTSDTERTNVVLPAPTPPAMTILLDIFFRLDRLSLEKSFETTKSPLQNLVFGRTAAGDGWVDVDQVLFGQVADQNLCHTEGDVQLGRHFGERPRFPAQFVDVDRLRHEGASRLLPRLGRRDQG